MKVHFIIFIYLLLFANFFIPKELVYSINNKILLNIDKGSKTNKVVLKIHRDSLNNKAVFSLFVNNNKTDSLIINYIDFSFDSLAKVNDTVWHYYYSSKRNAFSEYSKQLLIGEMNRKIHLLYVSDYIYSELPNSKDSTTLPYWYGKFQLSIKDSLNTANVTFSKWKTHRYTWEKGLIIDSVKNNYILKFDKENRIYYNSILMLDSTYSFYPELPPKEHLKKEDIKDLNFDHEKVFALEIGDDHYFYYQNKWFFLTHWGLRVIHPFPDLVY